MALPYPISDVFTFFTDAANLERITPPELCFQIKTPLPIEMGRGTVIDYHLRLYGIPFGWTTLITLWDPPQRFIDVQKRGPYKVWRHTHLFVEQDQRTRIMDKVVYQLPFWPLGELFNPLIRIQIVKIFSFREKAIREFFKQDKPNLVQVLLHLIYRVGANIYSGQG
jgi:ligand-binding SRPBCC domain-containing protein